MTSGQSSRQRVLAAIHHRPVDRLPMMYRGLSETDAMLCRHFGLGAARECSTELAERLGADLFSAGSAMGKFGRVAPKYVGPATDPTDSGHLDHVWGTVPQKISAGTHTYVEWVEHPMGEFSTVRQFEEYPSPSIDDFDFTGMGGEVAAPDRCLSSVGKLNHIFMIAARLRGMDRLLMDMAAEPVLAEALIEKVARFAIALNRKSLERAAGRVDHYTLWDDVAMQSGLMMGPTQWDRFLRPWYATLFADAKSHGLTVLYHCCGSFHPIIPTLIDLGVDVLDPVQTSAREMDLATLKRRYGNSVCWHGGIDVQKLLPHGSPVDVCRAVREARDLFGNDGGIVLGPSHEITPEVPIENILAVYGTQ